MYLELFHKLKLNPSNLKKETILLVVFTGKIIMLLGKIVQPIRVGNILKMIEFMVVDINYS